MGVTIKDIAKKTGLSITTISLVLNKKESRIPENTRHIIESAAQELKYSPNHAAVSLSTRKSDLIGLVIPRGTFYFFADLVSSMESACRNAGYSLSISLPEDDDGSFLEAIEEMLRRGADGVIVDPSGLSEDFYHAYRELVLQSEAPVCSLSGREMSAGIETALHTENADGLLPNSIVPDHRHGGYIAACHLLELGHQRIGLLAGPRESAADMLQGIEDALEEFNLGQDALSAIFGANSAAFGREGLDKLAASANGGGRISAIIAGSDSIASGILRRAAELGISVPGRLSVTGYGNSSTGAELSVPLTSVSIHCDRIARKAVNLIRKLNRETPAAEAELVPPSLIVRESTAACFLFKGRMDGM
jgi:LacI family transcriptional regulator